MSIPLNTKIYRYELLPEQKPCSIKNLLTQHGISLTNWRKLKSSASFYVNESLVDASQRLFPCDKLQVQFSQSPSSIIPEQQILDVIFEDEYLIIINKPPGLLVHPTVTSPTGTLVNFLAGYYLAKGLMITPHPIYRLDRNTSGLIIFAKEPFIQHALSSPTSVRKEYLALIIGKLPNNQGMIDAPIARQDGSIIERCVDFTRGKPARTNYEVLNTYNNGLSLVRFLLLTGRTHQIRVHAAYLGCPLLNDSLYGKPGVQSRHALHCHRITFIHPVSKEKLCLCTPLPHDLLNFIKQ